MGQSWYYSRGAEQFGPITLDQLKEIVRTGQVDAGSLVWTEGMAQWLPVQQVPELNVGAAQAPTAQPVGQPWQQQGYTTSSVLGYQSVVGGPEYAGFWIRFVAAIVDGLVMFVPGCIVGAIIGGVGAAMGARPNTPEWSIVQVFGNVISIVMNWIYFALMESSAKQASLGKMALGIKVVDLNGARIGFGQATGRYFGKIVSAIILLVGYMMAGWTEKKQALHDIMAGTLVVRGKA